MLVKHVGVDVDVNSMFNDTIDMILNGVSGEIKRYNSSKILRLCQVVLVSVSQIVLVLLS